MFDKEIDIHQTRYITLEEIQEIKNLRKELDELKNNHYTLLSKHDKLRELLRLYMLGMANI